MVIESVHYFFNSNLGWLARDKHSSLVGSFVSNEVMQIGDNNNTNMILDKMAVDKMTF